jgi:chromosome segregation ATPase
VDSAGISLQFRLRVVLSVSADEGHAGRLPPTRSAGRYSGVTVDGSSQEEGFRQRMTRQGEETIGKLAQELLENPVVSGAVSAALETRERAMRAQEAALGALNLPSASDLERLTRRLRSVSQRLEGVEDVLDRVEERVAGLDEAPLAQRLEAIEAALERIESALTERSGSPTR